MTNYTIEKSSNSNGPWTALVSLPAPATHYSDAGNAMGAVVCYRITPTNPTSTGKPAQDCSQTYGVVGDMPKLTIIPTIQ